MVALVVKQIKPKKLRQDAFRVEMLNAIRDIGKGMEKDFKSTTSTWKTDVEFETIRSFPRLGGKIEILVGTDNEIYGYVDKGTSVRYATMTDDFSPKTKPRVLGSSSGSGGLLYVNKNRPRPGIKAREFSETIQKKWEPRLKREVEKALREARKKSGHEIN